MKVTQTKEVTVHIELTAREAVTLHRALTMAHNLNPAELDVIQPLTDRLSVVEL
tara:strand:- start:42909 stop:43070 length:162 start_codon:yes stop_codon:yes gene_type:complete